MVSCLDVAKFFLLESDADAGDLISNLKLQKLVYYAQGFHLALFGRPLFPEEIQAWVHGPVVPELYRYYRDYGANPLPLPDDFRPKDVFSSDEIELLNDVQRVFGQFSAWKLRNMTYQEPPWKDTESGQVIPHGLMEEYFKTLLVEA